MDRVNYPDVNEDPNVGEWFMRQYLSKNQPKIHIFGHIHEGYGFEKFGNTSCYNVSICTDEYKPENPITVIDL
jgi:Icc-related predicted phosphoesterase